MRNVLCKDQVGVLSERPGRGKTGDQMANEEIVERIQVGNVFLGVNVGEQGINSSSL